MGGKQSVPRRRFSINKGPVDPSAPKPVRRRSFLSRLTFRRRASKAVIDADSLGISWAVPGAAALTPYGPATIVGVRGEDGVVLARPTTWFLATGKPPVLFLQASQVTPAFYAYQRVKTQYGLGVVKEVRRDNVIVVEINSWELAYGCRPTVFLQADALEVPATFAVGETVQTQYGEGKIVKKRWDGVYEVRATKWELAYKQIPHMFVQADCMRRVLSASA